VHAALTALVKGANGTSLSCSVSSISVVIYRRLIFKAVKARKTPVFVLNKANTCNHLTKAGVLFSCVLSGQFYVHLKSKARILI
jgi:hypothetical protein